MARPKAIIPVTDDTDFIRPLIYGEPGVGKTRLLGTSPHCLIIDADEGTESAKRHLSTADKYVPHDWDDMIEIQDYLRHEDHGYEWVWLDGITLWQEKGLDHIMEDLVAARPHRKPWAPDKGEYGQNMNRISMWVRTMKTLPINFGITAHVLRQEDDDGKIVYMPAVQGINMPQKICGYMNIVAYMTATRRNNVIERKLITEKRGKYYAKDRFDALGGTMLLSDKQATIPEMMRLIGVNHPDTAKVIPMARRRKPVAAKKSTTRTVRSK